MELSLFYPELINGNLNSSHVYDLFCKQTEKVIYFTLLYFQIAFHSRRCREMSGWCDKSVWILSSRFSSFASQIGLFTLPVSFAFVLLMESRYPNGVSLLNKKGIPCLLRSDLRSSFLSYYSRMINTQIRRYEIGRVTRTKSSDERDLVTQHACSIDNIWLQRYSFIARFTSDKMIPHWACCILAKLWWCAAIF